MRDNTGSTLEEIRDKIIEYSESEDPIELIESLYYIYIRENVTGPSIYTLYAEEEKWPLIKGEALVERELDLLSNKNEALQELLIKHFERDSEQIYVNT